MRIDHVVVGVADLERAAERFEAEFGLASVPGARHPGWGTGNRIVPLGDSYLELVGVVDQEEAERSSFGRAILTLVEKGDRLLLWCVATEDLEAVAARLDLTVARGSRILPDGTEVRWRSAGLEGAVADRSLPFFIHWEVPPERHPGRMPAPHRTAPAGIAWVEVGGPEEPLRDWLGEALTELPVRVGADPPGLRAVGVALASGEELVIR
ncbi:MAG TPA: VOC family protein [Actinomycetota bacterium]|nr:VOC family protein [Actinomycetota bacterium]